MNLTRQHKLLLKPFLAITLCISMFMSIVPLSYAAKGFGEELTPPPELIIGEGEEWIPGAIDPFSISTYGEDDECKHHGRPVNYRYIGAVRGNTVVDAIAVDIVSSLVTLWIPSPYNLPLDIYFLVEGALSAGDQIYADYIKYQYIYNSSPDPNMYWHHTFFDFSAPDDAYFGGDCYATYSPPKPGDPYQD